MIEAHTGAGIRAAEQPLLDEGLGDTLMRRAAAALARECERQLRSVSREGALGGARAVVLAGPGNNGGDGLWAGAFLRRRGVAVTAVLTGTRAHEAGLAALVEAGGTVKRMEEGSSAADLSPQVAAADTVDVSGAVSLMASADLVVDAVLGTGASGGLRGPAAQLAAAFGESVAPGGAGSPARPRVVACDLVSGVCADTGQAPEPLLRAHATVTFGGAKVGHVVSPGEQAGGELVVAPIGIEDRLGPPSVHRIEPGDVLAAWPRPGATDTKYSRGVVGVVAGAPSYPGAALMCTQAAVSTGAGMVRFLGDATARSMVLSRTPEVVCSDDQPWDVHVQAWLAGPGVVGDESQAARVQAVIEAQEPAVLDAGALDAAARSVADARLGPHKILTPHAGELSQVFEWLHGFGLSGTTVEREEIEANPLHWAQEAARLTGATVLLKGATTVVASPVGGGQRPGDGTGSGQNGAAQRGCLCLSVGDASPWLATAGSGDTLAGILGAVLAHVAEHPDALVHLGDWARGDGRWAAAAAAGAGLHALASRAHGEGPVPPSVLAENVREVLTRP